MKNEQGEFLVAGRKVTGFSNEEERSMELETIVPFLLQTRFEERGAKFQQGKPWEAHVVIDDRLVTGQNPASAAAVAKSINWPPLV